MFYSLTGKVAFFNESSVAINCAGVSYLCSTTTNTLKKIAKIDEEVTLYTYLNVREDAMDLYGFYDKKELDCYKMLISVTGVGPKAGLAILSQLTPEKFALCVATGDTKTITTAQGVGPKIAQRIILELKDKLKSGLPDLSMGEAQAAGVVSSSSNAGEAVNALEILGYSRSDASMAVGGLDSSLEVQDLIKQALKLLS